MASVAMILVVLAMLEVFFALIQWGEIPMAWWSCGGGAIEILLLTAAWFFVPRIGSLPWQASIITGQWVAAKV